MRKPYEVVEYDIITCNREYEGYGNCKVMDTKDFDNLKQFIYEFAGNEQHADPLDFMRISYKRYIGDIVTIKNYVGLIQFKNGFQIEVLPKIDFVSGEDQAHKRTKKIFTKMLCCLKDFPAKIFNDAHLQTEKMSLYEVFINMYLQEVQRLLMHGLKHGYDYTEDNLNCYKGKLLVNQHIRANLVHRERFFVAYDEFNANRPENRLIKSTLLKLKKNTSSAENAKMIGQLLISFELVEPSINYVRDFSKVYLNRNNEEYAKLMQWSKVFLVNQSFTTFSGNTITQALLFPMEYVYESYVAKHIQSHFRKSQWKVKCQAASKYLFDEPSPKFSLRPDIILEKDGYTIVMDTKWKRLNADVRSNYGISQADMYQMYAYSKKYGAQDIWLIYPVNETVRALEDICYKSLDGVNIHVFFVDLENIDESMAYLEQEIAMP